MDLLRQAEARRLRRAMRGTVREMIIEERIENPEMDYREFKAHLDTVIPERMQETYNTITDSGYGEIDWAEFVEIILKLIIELLPLILLLI